MFSIFLSEYPTHSYIALATFPIVPYEFVAAHFAKDEENHYIIGIFEAIPIIGALIALFESFVILVCFICREIVEFLKDINEEVLRHERERTLRSENQLMQREKVEADQKLQLLFFTLNKKEADLEESLSNHMPFPIYGNRDQINKAFNIWRNRVREVPKELDSIIASAKKEFEDFIFNTRSIEKAPFFLAINREAQRLREKLKTIAQVDEKISWENRRKAEMKLLMIDAEKRLKEEEEENLSESFKQFNEKFKQIILDKNNFLDEVKEKVNSFLKESLEKIESFSKKKESSSQVVNIDTLKESLSVDYKKIQELDSVFTTKIAIFSATLVEISKIREQNKDLLLYDQRFTSIQFQLFHFEKLSKEAKIELEKASDNFLDEALSQIKEKLEGIQE